MTHLNLTGEIHGKVSNNTIQWTALVVALLFITIVVFFN